MQTGLVLEWDREEARVLKERRLESAVFAAMRKSGRDTIRTLRTDAQRHIRARKRLKVARINRGLVLRMPSGVGRDFDKLVWRVDVSNRGIPLGDYSVRQTKKGVSVAVNKGGKRGLIRGAFLATMKSGHRGVYVRRGKQRLPIDELFSTRLADVIKDRGLTPQLFQRAGKVWKSSYARLLPLEVAKVLARRQAAAAAAG